MNLQRNDTNELAKQKKTPRLPEQTYGCQGKGCGEGIVREFGIDIYTLLYVKWITNQELLCSIENSTQCYVAAWKGREFAGKFICVYVWLSLFVVHLKLSQYCNININKKLKK